MTITWTSYFSSFLKFSSVSAAKTLKNNQPQSKNSLNRKKNLLFHICRLSQRKTDSVAIRSKVFLPMTCKSVKFLIPNRAKDGAESPELNRAADQRRCRERAQSVAKCPQKTRVPAGRHQEPRPGRAAVTWKGEAPA